MRIVAVSDTHQNTDLLARCVQQAVDDGKIDVFIHCGDGVRDLHRVETLLTASNPDIRIYAVRGNCDVGASLVPDTETANLNGVRVLITHGNGYHVKHGLGKLSKAAKALRMDLVFFGHTHRQTVEEKRGVLLLNPGSLSAESAAGTAYLEVVIDENQKICERFIKLGSK